MPWTTVSFVGFHNLTSYAFFACQFLKIVSSFLMSQEWLWFCCDLRCLLPFIRSIIEITLHYQKLIRESVCVCVSVCVRVWVGVPTLHARIRAHTYTHTHTAYEKQFANYFNWFSAGFVGLLVKIRTWFTLLKWTACFNNGNKIKSKYL